MALMPSTFFLPALEFSHPPSQHILFMRNEEGKGGAGKRFLFQLLYHFLFFVPLFSPVSEGGRRRKNYQRWWNVFHGAGSRDIGVSRGWNKCQPTHLDTFPPATVSRLSSPPPHTRKHINASWMQRGQWRCCTPFKSAQCRHRRRGEEGSSPDNPARSGTPQLPNVIYPADYSV